MQFNYQNEYVSQSPLDFNYRFGLNDNSADKFNYNNISIISNMINNISSNNTPQLASTLIDASNLLVDNTTVEISSITMNTISFTKSLSTETLSKLNTKFDTTSFINSILKTTFNGLGNIFSNINGDTLANKWASVSDAQKTGITTEVYNRNTMKLESPTDTTSADAYALAMSSISMITSAVNLGFNIANNKAYTESYKNMIDKKIELLNETIEANREFMQQARDEMAKRQQRFSKSNRLLSM